MLKAKRVFFSAFLSLYDIKWITNYKLAKNKYFSFDSHTLEYYFHSYNNFGITERKIEIPIIKYYLDNGNYCNALEIGNVTNHYYDYFKASIQEKTVVDKYELAYGVINQDICKFDPGVKFDFTFSISTFEHMDSDRGKNPEYVKGASRLTSHAADNIRYVSNELLGNGGKFVLTAPLGYSLEWDQTLYSDDFEKCNFSAYKIFVYKRISELVWEQVEPSEGKGVRYNHPLRGANYLCIVEFDKNA